MFDLSLVQPLDVLDWFKKKSESTRYLKNLCVKFDNVSHAELAINIFNAIIAIVWIVDFFLDDANQMARSDILTDQNRNLWDRLLIILVERLPVSIA